MNGLFNYVFNIIILIAPFFYTIVSLADFIKTKFDKEASFEISENGLFDNLSIFSCGKINWHDIESFELTKNLYADFLIIKVYDNNKFLAGKNIIHRYVLKKYIKKWGSPIVISDKRVDYKLEDIKQDILTNKPK
jgi:hypothetical protein